MEKIVESLLFHMELSICYLSFWFTFKKDSREKYHLKPDGHYAFVDEYFAAKKKIDLEE